MATSAFSPDSPYTRDLPLHPSDFRKLSFDIFAKKEIHQGKTPLMKKVRLVLFGTGRQGNVHLENILASPRIVLKYIVEDDETKWGKVREKWGLDEETGPTFLKAGNAGTALGDPEVDAVMVVTPTPTHQAIILSALQAGKHVFCEKPMAQTTEGVEQCFRAAEESGKTLFCAFNRRFDPSFRDAYNKVRKGEIGRVQQVQSISRDSPLPPISYLRTSGGMFHDCCIHDIDLLTWVIGEFPSEVWVNAGAMFPEIAAIGDVDNVVINFRFPSGALGIVNCCRYAAFGHDQRLEVFGRDGMVSVGNERPTSTVVHKWDGGVSCPPFQTTPSRYPQAYKEELGHFLDVVQGFVECQVTGAMVAGVQKICDACVESVKTGKPVKLCWEKAEIPAAYKADGTQ